MRHREAIQVYLYKIIQKEEKGPIAFALLISLRLLSYIYKLGVVVKQSLYRYGLKKAHRLPCCVISLGNLTVGGTGKTPTAIVLAKMIKELGYKVVVLNRGYRAGYKGDIGVVSDGEKMHMTPDQAGDEAYLLAKNLPSIPVVIGRNRCITGEYAVKTFGADVIILDDGYQHWRLARDLDIVLIDSLNVFGNNYLLPRGMLREPMEHLDRAHIFLLTKADQTTDSTRSLIRETLTKYNKNALIVESVHSPQYFIEVADWACGNLNKTVNINDVTGKKVLAFSAIGNPYSFEQTLSGLGAQVVNSVRFPDHHSYNMAEMQDVMLKALENGAAAIVTTEKDAVKIPGEFINDSRQLPVYVLGIVVKFTEEFGAFQNLIKKAIK